MSVTTERRCAVARKAEVQSVAQRITDSGAEFQVKNMISLETIEQARERIVEHIRGTPLVSSAALSELVGTQVSLKLEHHQLTGSFKLRGATNAVLQLSQSARDRGIVAASTGNHGRAAVLRRSGDGRPRDHLHVATCA
jgi:threonine dehydratase